MEQAIPETGRSHHCINGRYKIPLRRTSQLTYRKGSLLMFKEIWTAARQILAPNTKQFIQIMLQLFYHVMNSLVQALYSASNALQPCAMPRYSLVGDRRNPALTLRNMAHKIPHDLITLHYHNLAPIHWPCAILQHDVYILALIKG